MIFGWTQDDGALNTGGPGHLIQTEDDMVAPIKSFAHALSGEQLQSLFDLYPASDFEEDVENYVARKGVDDPNISVHYFRLSRIMRDLLFTCSSIEFGRQMVKQTRESGHPNFDSARLYDLNQSVTTPLFKGACMPYVGVSHGSDTNYIFNGVFPEGSLDTKDKIFSEFMTRSLINFAYTGNPNSGPRSQSQLPEWPPAYGESNEKSNPSISDLGGPYGTGPVKLPDSPDAKPLEGTDDSTQEPAAKGASGDYIGLGRMQQILSGTFNFGAMDSVASQTRTRLIQKEKLPQRCAYISSLSETLGI